MSVEHIFGIPTDADIESAALGRMGGPTQGESCRRIVEVLARDFPSWAKDREYAEYRVGVQVFGWDWEAFERDDDEAEAAAIDRTDPGEGRTMSAWRELLMDDFEATVLETSDPTCPSRDRMLARVDAWASLVERDESRIEELEAFVRKLAAEDWRGNKPQYVVDAERLLPGLGAR